MKDRRLEENIAREEEKLNSLLDRLQSNIDGKDGETEKNETNEKEKESAETQNRGKKAWGMLNRIGSSKSLDKLEKGEPVYIDREIFIVGRNQNVVDGILNGSNSVSGMHAAFIKENDEYFVKDLASRNGTCLNAEKVEKGKQERIKDGDILQFADLKYRLEIIKRSESKAYKPEN